MFVKKQMIWKVGVAALCTFGMLVQSVIPIGSLRGAAYALEDDSTPIIYA